jgi:predicted peroxiredoxin
VPCTGLPAFRLEAVRLVDRRQPQDLTWGYSKPIKTYYESFVRDGGRVMVCPHCSKAAGLEDGSLRQGARIARESEVAKAFLAADVVLDY